MNEKIQAVIENLNYLKDVIVLHNADGVGRIEASLSLLRSLQDQGLEKREPRISPEPSSALVTEDGAPKKRKKKEPAPSA